jgi:hypothetical protein
VTNPLRCLGQMLATFVGRALGAAFFLLGKARGMKALHPRGEVLEGPDRSSRRRGEDWCSLA